MRSLALVALPLTLALTLGLACSRPDRDGASDAGMARSDGAASASALGSSVSSKDHLSKVPHDSPPCRVVDSTGTTPDVPAGLPLPGGWIDLGDGGKLTVRHPKSLRESSFLGPGEVMPCARQAELHELRAGTYVSAPGSGESPGHEAWVVTPLGVVRYGVAGLTVQLDRSGKETIRVASGTARVWHPRSVVANLDKYSAVALDAGAHGASGPYEWTFIRDSSVFTLLPGAGVAPDAGGADIAAECLADAHVAADRARALRAAVSAIGDAGIAFGAGGGDGGNDFGARAAAHLVVIEATRAACDVAKLVAPERTGELERALLAGETGDEAP